jgi:hypothetical protein
MIWYVGHHQTTSFIVISKAVCRRAMAKPSGFVLR